MDPHVVILGLSLVAGMCGGFVAGLLGLGGGMVMVPIMNYVLPLADVPEANVMHAALVISLATMIYNTGWSAFIRWRSGELPLAILSRIAPAVAIGAVLGATLAVFLSSYVLRIVFLVYIAFVVVLEGWSDLHHSKTKDTNPAATDPPKLPRLLLTVPYFTATGTVGTLLGIGGALLTIPFMIGAGFATQISAATSSAVGSIVASVGTVGYIIGGQGASDMPSFSLGYLYLPALVGMLVGAAVGTPAGVRLSHHLGKPVLKGLFVATIAVVVVSMVAKLIG